jgi:hypothetical protein
VKGSLYLAGLFLSASAFGGWHNFNAQTSGAKNAEQPVELSVQREGASITMSVDIPGFAFDEAITNGGTFEEITLPGFGHTTDEGMPKLPVIRKLIEIPSEDAVLEIESASGDVVSLKGVGILTDLVPVQAPVAKLPGAFERALFKKNARIYNQDAFFPNFTARIVEVAVTRSPSLKWLRFTTIPLPAS